MLRLRLTTIHVQRPDFMPQEQTVTPHHVYLLNVLLRREGVGRKYDLRRGVARIWKLVIWKRAINFFFLLIIPNNLKARNRGVPPQMQLEWLTQVETRPPDPRSLAGVAREFSTPPLILWKIIWSL